MFSKLSFNHSPSMESALRYSLNQNRLVCAHLSYSDISSQLLEKCVLTKEHLNEIQLKSADSVGRMNGLVSFLVELNSGDGFCEFVKAVINSGEVFLGEKLLQDYQLIIDRVKTVTTPECLLTTVILNVILSNLDPCHQPNARLVCRTWDDAITKTQAANFRIAFKQEQQMVKFMNSGPFSDFYKRIRKFKFGPMSMESSERIFYESFFVQFGLNIVNLELSRLNTNLLRLIFSSNVQPYLRNVQVLKAEIFQNTAWLPADESLLFLSNLHSLDLTALATDESFLNMMQFLEQFVQNDHHLKAITLGIQSSQERVLFEPLSASLIRNIIKNHTIQVLAFQGCPFIFSNECLELMTVANERDSFFQTLNLVLIEVDLVILHKFLRSQSRTLEFLIFNVCANHNSFEIIQAFPRLESLKIFRIRLFTSPSGFITGWTSFSDFSFVTRMPKLEILHVLHIGNSLSPIAKESAPFEHSELRRLKFGFRASAIEDGTWIFSIIQYVPQCFPSLSSFEIHGASRVNASWRWPTKLGHLVLQEQTEQEIEADTVIWIAQAEK